MERRSIAASLEVARRNWSKWRDVFEHEGPVATNPLLADEHKFASFRREYYVNLTILKGRHDSLRRELCDSARFRRAIHDDSGRTLDELEKELRPRFGSKKGKNRIVSVLSKVAAFVRAERFVAWDRFAKKGLNILLGRSPTFPFKTYSDYLAGFDAAWEGQPGKQIRAYMAKSGPANRVEYEPQFLRRVLDVYLMRLGGRWSRKRRRK